MANLLGTGPGGVGELATLHPRRLELRHAVDGIEEAQEADPADRARKGLSKPFHEGVHLLFLLLPLGGLVSLTRLPAGKCLPGEDDHLLVPVGEKPDIIEHLGQEASDVGTAGEAKDVYLIAWIVETHQEAIAADDVLVKRRTNCGIFGLEIPTLHARDHARMGQAV